jgi:type IV pilus assembly protein PilV
MKKHQTNSQQGFTLLEVLIALLIVSFGMLGVAGLQLVTLKSNASSQYRSLAVNFAHEISERMRANPEMVINPTHWIPGVAYNAPAVSKTDSYINSFKPACKSLGCTPQELAQNDLAEWQQAIASTFPNGIGIVCIDSGTGTGTPSAIPGEAAYDGTVFTPNCDGQGNTFVVKIAWLENRSPEMNGATDTRAYSTFSTPVNP